MTKRAIAKRVNRLESSIERRVVEWARARGIMTSKLNTDSNCGMPDRVFWLPGGRPCFIEFKAPGAKPKRLQQHTLLKLTGLGYEAAWADNATEAITWLECVLYARKSEWNVHETRKTATN